MTQAGRESSCRNRNSSRLPTRVISIRFEPFASGDMTTSSASFKYSSKFSSTRDRNSFVSSPTPAHHQQRRQSNFACSARSSHAALSSASQSLLLTATPPSSILDIERRRLPRASTCASAHAREFKLARTRRRLNPGRAPSFARAPFVSLFRAFFTPFGRGVAPL